MLEEKIQRFRVGYKICNEMFKDLAWPEKSKYPPEIHETRIDGMERHDFMEGLGYVTALAKNGIMHPVIAYRVFRKKIK